MTVAKAKAYFCKMLEGHEADIAHAKLASTAASVHDINAGSAFLGDIAYIAKARGATWAIHQWITYAEQVKSWRKRLSLLANGVAPSEAYRRRTEP